MNRRRFSGLLTAIPAGLAAAAQSAGQMASDTAQRAPLYWNQAAQQFQRLYRVVEYPDRVHRDNRGAYSVRVLLDGAGRAAQVGWRAQETA